MQCNVAIQSKSKLEKKVALSTSTMLQRQVIKILDTVIEVNDEEIDDESITDNNDVQEPETAQKD